MIVWKERVYCKGISPKRQKRVMHALDKRRPVRSIYLIVAPSNPENCLEYMQANLLLQPYYKKRDVIVYGMAPDEATVQELAATMVCSAFATNGDFNIVGYLDSKNRKAGDSA